MVKKMFEVSRQSSPSERFRLLGDLFQGMRSIVKACSRSASRTASCFRRSSGYELITSRTLRTKSLLVNGF